MGEPGAPLLRRGDTRRRDEQPASTSGSATFCPFTSCSASSRAGRRTKRSRSSRRLASLGAVGILVGWLAAYSFYEHPDYLASFSEVVRAPEEIVSDSDLDWGQDLRRLSTRVRELGIERIAIGACSTCRYPECADLPEARSLAPGEPVEGWVAIGEWCLRVWPRSGQVQRSRMPSPGWRDGVYERVGKSIRLYYLPPGAEGDARGGAETGHESQGADRRFIAAPASLRSSSSAAPRPAGPRHAAHEGCRSADTSVPRIPRASDRSAGRPRRAPARPRAPSTPAGTPGAGARSSRS